VNNNDLNNLLKQYLANTISKDDYEKLMHHISRSASDHELHQLMKEDWEDLAGEQSIDNTPNNILYQKIIADPRFKLTKKRVDKPAFSFRMFIRVAAGVLLFLCVGLVVNYHLKKIPQQKEIVYQEKIIPLGQKTQMELSDGTVIWLNSGSRIKFPLNFTGDKRELYLQGEAYFDVAHDASRPFIIHTGNVITQVIGTAFNIKAYGPTELDITVSRGKVSVGLKNRQLGVLTSNRGLSYNIRNNLARQYYTNAAKVRWMYGDLIFDNINMNEAAKTLERWYNITITVSDPKVKAYRFTASFLKHENIDQVLKVLSELTHFTYSQQGKNFIIRAQ
jgi:transmembrane sensor